MTSIRTFIAITLPTPIQNQLGKIILQFKDAGCKEVRWVDPANIHLTLKFLGDVPTTDFEKLVEVVHSEAARHEPFEIQIEGLGSFPNIRSPRVIWVGIIAPPSLADLQRGVDLHTRQLGFPGEDRPFSPHLTLGRVPTPSDPSALRKILDCLTKIKVGNLGKVMVESIHVYRSDLKPSGAVYTLLCTNYLHSIKPQMR